MHNWAREMTCPHLHHKKNIFSSTNISAQFGNLTRLQVVNIRLRYWLRVQCAHQTSVSISAHESWRDSALDYSDKGYQCLPAYASQWLRCPASGSDSVTQSSYLLSPSAALPLSCDVTFHYSWYTTHSRKWCNVSDSELTVSWHHIII